MSVGPAKDASGTVVWGINHAGEIYRWTGASGTGNSWNRIDGLLTNIAVGASSVWGVNRAGQVYRRASTAATGPGWENVQGSLAGIAVGASRVWGVDGKGGIWRRELTGTANTWVPIAGSLIQIAASPSGICGVNAQGKPWYWVGGDDTGNRWVPLGASDPHPAFKNISIGSWAGGNEGGLYTVWATDIADNVWYLQQGAV